MIISVVNRLTFFRATTGLDTCGWLGRDGGLSRRGGLNRRSGLGRLVRSRGLGRRGGYFGRHRCLVPPILRGHG